MAAKVQAPKGFKFRTRKDPYDYGDRRVFIELYADGKKEHIGRINLVPIGGDVYETHSYLDPAYRQKGLGTLLYARAIEWGVKNGFKVRSSISTSNDAQRVWGGKSLRKFFSVKKRVWKNQYGGQIQKWYAYAKGA